MVAFPGTSKPISITNCQNKLENKLVVKCKWVEYKKYDDEVVVFVFCVYLYTPSKTF